jgi:RNA polymerase sigma factor (sigma-70 family)
VKQKLTIDELYEGVKKRERAAQEMLYRSLAGKMLAICSRYANSTFEAEDMMQSGFIKVFTKIDFFRGEGSFEGWIKRIMVHTAIEILRKNQRTLETVALEPYHENANDAFSLDALECEDLRRIILELPEGYRMVFNMYAIEGYSHKEIGEMLQISEGASKSQLSRARSWLKQRIQELEVKNV